MNKCVEMDADNNIDLTPELDEELSNGKDPEED